MFQIELSKNYNFNEWKEDMKKVCMTAGVNKITLVFFFSDTQVLKEVLFGLIRECGRGIEWGVRWVDGVGGMVSG